MLSYQHTYHAGNHADVLKHIILGDVLAGMQQKEKAVFMLDAFASRGMYDLKADEALKTLEFETGIGKLWGVKRMQLPAGVSRWLNLIASENPNGGFSRFPGSTAVLASMRREQDRLVACDLHPQEFEGLRKSGLKSSRKFSFQHRDAFEALKAFLPPHERRGLIFLDPSYELKDEYKRIAKSVIEAHSRFAEGVYVIWYPILPAGRHSDLINTLHRSGIRKIMRIELDGQGAFPDLQMQGSGMLIINPPWAAQKAMQASLKWISNQLLPKGQGRSHLDWLTRE